jgi:aryl-alcohol dehydrogenase-like predicted oxidoreductase
MTEAASETIARERAKRIGLGTAQFGLNYGISNKSGKVSVREAAKILLKAREHGMLWLDTAAAYGHAESTLGDLRAPEMGFLIVTKTLPMASGFASVIERVYRSLELLKVDKLNGLLVHQARDLLGPLGAGYWDALERLKATGLVTSIGISTYYEDDPLELVKTFQPDFVQLPVSILDQRLVRDGTLAAIKELGVLIHARSIFLQGLLFVATERLPPKLKPCSDALALVKEMIADCGSSPLNAAISFVLERPEVDVAVVGVTSVRELSEIAAAARNPPPPLIWSDLAINEKLLLTPSLWHG